MTAGPSGTPRPHTAGQPADQSVPHARDAEELEERVAERQIGRDLGPGGPPGREAGAHAAELLVIQIADGRFDGDWYRHSTGQARLLVKTRGGPCLFSIDGLLEPRELPAPGTTEISLRLSEPGRHTMRLRTPAGRTATAALDIHR
jgi:hypothetical protein